MTDPAWDARAEEALSRTDIMAISTLRPDGSSYTCPVQFHYEAGGILRFASQPGAKHVQYLEGDSRVSGAIYAVPGPPGGNLSVQFVGTVQRTQGAAAAAWQQFEVEVEEAWCFDSRVDLSSRKVRLK